MFVFLRAYEYTLQVDWGATHLSESFLGFPGKSVEQTTETMKVAIKTLGVWEVGSKWNYRF